MNPVVIALAAGAAFILFKRGSSSSGSASPGGGDRSSSDDGIGTSHDGDLTLGTPPGYAAPAPTTPVSMSAAPYSATAIDGARKGLVINRAAARLPGSSIIAPTTASDALPKWAKRWPAAWKALGSSSNASVYTKKVAPILENFFWIDLGDGKPFVAYDGPGAPQSKEELNTLASWIESQSGGLGIDLPAVALVLRSIANNLHWSGTPDK